MAVTTTYSWFHGTNSLLNNVFTNGNQFGPAVTGNAAGDRYFGAWTDPDNSGQAQARVINAEQTPLTNEFIINNTANAGTAQIDPSVAGLSDGDFVVTYTDFAADAGGDIRARLYSPNGTARGLDFAINDGSNHDTGSSVAHLSGGGFVVAWHRGNVGLGDIRAAMFDANGDEVGPALITVSNSATQESTPSVAGLHHGGFVVAWQDNSAGEVYFRRYQNDGAALDADRVLIDTAGSVNQDIHVVGLADGGFAVAYLDSGWSIDGTEITFRIFNADGTTRTNFIRANNAAFDGVEAGDQIWPTITTMGDLIVVGWRGADTGISYAQVFNANGNALGTNSSFDTQVVEHEIAGLANGQLASVTASNASEGFGLGDSIRTKVSQFVRTQTGDGANDVIFGVDDELQERLVGGGGDDLLIGGAGGDMLIGGLGFDMVSYETAPAGVTVSLADPSINTGHAAGDSYALIESVDGSDFDDTLIGGSTTRSLSGGDGNDTLIGGRGIERIDGGDGADTAVFSLSFNDYTVHDFGAEIRVSGPEGFDAAFTSIEHLQFADTTITPADVANDGSPLFDTLYYLSRNADVFQAGVNALDHYNMFGRHEGRDPNAFFDTSGYLAVNKDVAAAGANPLEHYHQNGWHEGRDPSADFDTTLYLIHNPDVAAAGVDPLEHFLRSGWAEGRKAYEAVGQSIAGGFDAQYYLFHNPDVAAAGVDALAHYNEFGWHEGRNPNAWFDTAGYLSHYADVAAAGVNPLQHYAQFGWQEGRDPSAAFDTLGYLAANPDVAAAHVNPLQHYLQYGIYEGRTAVNDGLWG